MGLTVYAEEKAQLEAQGKKRLELAFCVCSLNELPVISLARRSRLPPTPADIFTNSHPQRKPHLSSFLFHFYQTWLDKTSKQHCPLSRNIPILNHSTQRKEWKDPFVKPWNITTNLRSTNPGQTSDFCLPCTFHPSTSPGIAPLFL